MTPFIAEIIGTMLLMILGSGVCANVALKKTHGNGSGWIVITTGWAFAVYIGVVVAAPYSGAHLNPAVTIGLAVGGSFPWVDVPLYIVAQFMGAMLGSTLIWVMYKDHFDATESGDTKRGVFCNTPAIRNVFTNLFGEMLGTFVLVFTIFFMTDASINDTGSIIGLGSIGALPVALLVWAIGLSLGGTTGYAINPARDMGPRIMHAILPFKSEKSGNDWSYSWIPVVGPILGGVIAAGMSMMLT